MTEFHILTIYKKDNGYGGPTSEYNNESIKKWLNENSQFEPYGNLYVNEKNGIAYQSFVKYSDQLNDKFLEKFLEEIKHIPGVGSAYREAEENFNKQAAKQKGSNKTAGGNKKKKNKTRRKKCIPVK